MITKDDYKKYRLVYYLIILNLIFFLVSVVCSKGFNIKIDVLRSMGASNGDLIRSGDYYRILTSAFLHASVMHIFVNMYSLYSLGRTVISIVGEGKFLLIYLVSAAASGLTSLLNNNYSVGASGAIFGLLGFMLVFVLINRKYIRKDAIMQLVFVTVINLSIGFRPGSRIDNFGHIGGLIAGIIISIIILKWSDK